MNARVYLNTSTLSATSRIDGGGFTPPAVRAYSDVILRFRLAREIEGESVPDDREIDSVSARIGYQDAEPTAGTVTLEVTVGSDTVTAAALAYNATAATVQTAINTALDNSALDALHPCTVTETDEGYRIVFADTAETVTMAAASNKLWPLSFVNADRVEFDGGWATILAYRQAPVAEVDVAEETVPSAPVITRIQAGSTEDGVSINEIQKLTLNPAYSGATFRIEWDGIKSPVLPGFPTVEQIQTALDEIAPDNGTFTLIALEDGVLIECAGSMAGEAQTLMTTEEFTAPPTEWLVKLPTNTAAMRTMMAGAGSDNEIELPLDVVVTVLDDDAPEGEQKLIFPFEVTFTRPVADDSRNVAAGLDWTQPLSRTSNAPFSTNSLLVGNRAMRFTIGDGAATSFALSHNLGSLSAAFTVNASTEVCTSANHNLHNGDPVTVSSTTTLPGGLSAGVTYYVISATTNTFQLSATPNGSAVNITSSGSGTHSFLVADGTTDAVFVEVWEKAGGLSRLSPEDYTVVRTSANLVTVSGFASTPTSNQYEVIVMTAGRPATYQAHTHTIAEVTGLQTALDTIGDRLSALELLAPVDYRRPAASTGTYLRETNIRNFGEVYPVSTRTGAFRLPVGSLLSEFDADTLGRGTGRLFGALHKSSTTSLDTIDVTEGGVKILPTPSASFLNTVYINDVAQVVTVPGGGGHPSMSLAVGEFVACDGDYWYKVVQYGSGSSTTYYPVSFERTLFYQGISGEDLISGREMEALLDLEIGLLEGAESGMVYYLAWETGTWPSDTTPSTTGGNLQNIIWAAAAAYEDRILLTTMPDRYSLGFRVTRDGNTLTATAKNYGVWKAATAPSATSFALRLRLIRADTENAASTPSGRIFLSGPSFDGGGEGVGKVRIF